MITFTVAETASDKAAVVRLRDAVYVRDQGRLEHTGDTATTFDRYDEQAIYLLARQDGEAVGTVKVIPDSPAGLPCGEVVDLAGLRTTGRLVEFGHLMTLPHVRNRSLGRQLMRQALVHSVRTCAATHVLGDFFVDERGRLLDFYLMLGFVPLGEPYEDGRFKGAPLSVVAALDLVEAARHAHDAPGRQGELLRYFFHDYAEHAEASHAR
jgi:putrescine aminotransferase